LNCAANKKRQRRRHTFAAGIIYERAGRRTGKDSITENATCPEIQAGPITFVSLSLGYPCIGSFPLSYQYIEVDDMKTLRKQMMMLLGDNEMSAREISSAVGIGEKEVYGHLSHIARSIKSHGKKLAITPAQCMGCGPAAAPSAKTNTSSIPCIELLSLP
jgi:predicted Zn-ribbon and HTH transcriptional regulator